MRRVEIRSGEVSLTAELLDTPTAEAIWQALPIASEALIWGQEVYFDTPLRLEAEPDARALVEAGELAFWLAGGAIAVCYGPTPISGPGEIRLASAANVWGRLTGDPGALAGIADGDPIEVLPIAD